MHEAQRRSDVRVDVVPGGTVTERWIPVRRVGLYVPGGLAVYPSSVVMNVVPAQVAGVSSLVVCSPAQKEFGGLPHPTILAACALLGVDEVYAVGGAQAIALLAYGDDGMGIEPVDLVTGPGNVYVAAAKRLLRGVIGIDAEAGPTEIAVLADAGADPVHVAADLISQAEHDPLAASVLVTDSVALADAVDVEIERQVELTKHTERIRAALSGEQSATVLVRDLEQGLAVVDAYAAEHLEVITSEARAVGRAGPQRRVRFRRRLFAGLARRLLRRVEPRPSDRLHGPARVGAVGAVVPQGRAPRRVHVGRADRSGAVRARAGRGRGPSSAWRGGRRPAAVVTSLEQLPLRDELRGVEPYGAPQLDVAVALNTNENPYGPSETVVQAIATAMATPRRNLNRYPDREALDLRFDLAAYLNDDGADGLGVGKVWAANGSNEIMLQLMQAFGGPGRTAVSFAPTYSMYPEYARDSHTRWVVGRRADHFTLDLPAALELIEREQPSIVLLCSPNNPTGTSLSLAEIEAVYAAAPGVVIVDEAYAEFRRARHAERADDADRATRGWS